MIKKDLKEFSDIFNKIKDGCPILVCGNKDDYNAMTINWGGFGYLWDKNVAFIFVRKDRYSYNFSEKYDNFTLSFLENQSPHIKEIFGLKSGKDIDKFKASNLHPCLDIDNNMISVSEAKMVLKLKKLVSIDLEKSNYSSLIIKEFYNDKPYHMLYICEIKQFLVGE